jgi:hypothetical protein
MDSHGEVVMRHGDQSADYQGALREAPVQPRLVDFFRFINGKDGIRRLTCNASLKGVYGGGALNQSMMVTGSVRLEAFRQTGESLAR